LRQALPTHFPTKMSANSSQETPPELTAERETRRTTNELVRRAGKRSRQLFAEPDDDDDAGAAAELARRKAKHAKNVRDGRAREKERMLALEAEVATLKAERKACHASIITLEDALRNEQQALGRERTMRTNVEAELLLAKAEIQRHNDAMGEPLVDPADAVADGLNGMHVVGH